jgi:hypothetical protein
MRVKCCARSFKQKLWDEKSKPARLIALLACCLLLAACPSSGGDLLPLPQSGGDELESASFKNDTLSVTHNQITIKARGNWSVSDSDTWLTLEIKNAGAKAVTISFDNCELINQSSREKLSLRSLADKEKAAPAFINERTVAIESGQTKSYYASFFIKSADGRASVSRNVEGQTVTLSIPALVQGETSAPVDFLFSFKYVEYQH